MPVSADEHLCVTMCAAVAFRDHKVPLTLSVQPWFVNVACKRNGHLGQLL